MSPDSEGTTLAEWSQELAADQSSSSIQILQVRADDLTHLQREVVIEALDAAKVATWERASARFRWAISRPGEYGPGHPNYSGNLTVSELQERDAELAAIALACSRKARMLRTRRGLI